MISAGVQEDFRDARVFYGWYCRATGQCSGRGIVPTHYPQPALALIIAVVAG